MKAEVLKVLEVLKVRITTRRKRNIVCLFRAGLDR